MFRMKTALSGTIAATSVGALVVAGLSLGASGAGAAGNTLIVGNPTTCTGSTYRTIQSAVDAASSGDTIQVCAGTYGEHVDVSTPGLTILGNQSGQDARGKRAKATASIVSNAAGEFTIESSADGTTIEGFVLTGASGNNDGIADFLGSSGLTLMNNVIQLNGNGINLQNPDGSQPAMVSQNSFINNNAGGLDDNGQSGTGIFISNGPANNTSIQNNNFRQHSQTAINFGGDGSDLSTGLSVTGNHSTDDSTFVVAGNSTGAVISTNIVSTSDNAPGGHGTGILDFGSNSSLRISNNTMKATGATTSSGVSVSDVVGSSDYTAVSGNKISGWFNDIKVTSGNQNASVSGNTLSAAQNDGIIVQPEVSGVTLAGNKISTATNFACEDQTTGSGTAGTANTWTNNVGTTASSPTGICRLRAPRA